MTPKTIDGKKTLFDQLRVPFLCRSVALQSKIMGKSVL